MLHAGAGIFPQPAANRRGLRTASAKPRPRFRWQPHRTSKATACLARLSRSRAMMAARGAHGKALGHHESATVAARAETQLIATRQRGGEEHGMLEGDLRGRQQQPEHLERLA